MGYTQPYQEHKSFTHDNPGGNTGTGEPGIACVECGRPGFEHERVKDFEDGMIRYRLECPQ